MRKTKKLVKIASMKTTILMILLLATSPLLATESFLLPILEIHDGDTIKTQIFLPPPLDKISVRIKGIDTPEMPAKSFPITGKLGRAKCIKEATLAIQARNKIIELSNQTKIMKITNFQYGKYSGRILADVEINGVDVANFLISRGLAVSYTGGTKTKNWCE